VLSFEDFAQNLGLALLLGLIIGLEREWRGRDAGMRTNGLVAAGAAVFTMASAMFADSGRVASQIVTGIGFLGAGTILKSGEHVSGLTTAATLWSVAAMGMIAGSGHLKMAVLVAAVILVVNAVLLPLEHYFKNRPAKPPA
jgi:putative Mg2+ transporter-C (MgtC) family protein